MKKQSQESLKQVPAISSSIPFIDQSPPTTEEHQGLSAKTGKK